MPKGPIFENRVTREIVVAIVMGVLLVTSLTAAWFLTGATLGF